MSGIARIPSDAPGTARAVASHLDAGGLLAYPTETVYGLGANVGTDQVRRVAAIKGRTEEHPFLVLVPTVEAAEELKWTDAARVLAAGFWPGPLTLVLADPDRRFPAEVRSEAGAVGVRVSPHPFLRALAGAWPHALISTSANASGEPPATTADEVESFLRARSPGTELLLVDGGRLPPSPPSTVVDCTGGVPAVVREGAIPVDRLLELVPTTVRSP